MAATLRLSSVRHLNDSLQFLFSRGDRTCNLSRNFRQMHRRLFSNLTCVNKNSVKLLISDADTKKYLSTGSWSYHQNQQSDPPDNRPLKPEKSLVSLMNFEEIIWPSIFKSLRNYLTIYFLIKPFLDKEFALEEFMRGAKQALLSVSELLSEGNFQALTGLVTEDALEEIKKNISSFNKTQRYQLGIQNDDVYLAFPYDVAVEMDAKQMPEIRKGHIEITVCFHCFPGFGETRRNDPSLSNMFEQREKIIVCNYTFVREFSSGMQGNWVISKLNHFQPPMTP